jgi:hypothetical protein
MAFLPGDFDGRFWKIMLTCQSIREMILIYEIYQRRL